MGPPSLGRGDAIAVCRSRSSCLRNAYLLVGQTVRKDKGLVGAGVALVWKEGEKGGAERSRDVGGCPRNEVCL